MEPSTKNMELYYAGWFQWFGRKWKYKNTKNCVLFHPPKAFLLCTLSFFFLKELQRKVRDAVMKHISTFFLEKEKKI